MCPASNGFKSLILPNGLSTFNLGIEVWGNANKCYTVKLKKHRRFTTA